MNTRKEVDIVGMLEVPEEAYFGIHALRAKENFNISSQPIHSKFIKNLARVKKAAALTNIAEGTLNKKKGLAICKACEDIIDGMLVDEFIVDVFQGGAGTSTNMNANEVIANRAIEYLGGSLGDYTIIHPNDHVNMCQSTNDVIPTAGKMTVIQLLELLKKELIELQRSLEVKSREFSDIIKMGRTQMQDALPMRLGQSFKSFSRATARDVEALELEKKYMYEVNLGGTAIGSGVNATRYYAAHIVETLATISEMPLKSATDKYDATSNLDGLVRVSSALKTCGVNLTKMCNDLRLMSSGPTTGLGEINLPSRQNGSSIMPGKINPVIPEMVNQVAFQVIGNDVTIGFAAASGQLELNAFEPIIFKNIFESLDSLTGAVKSLRINCIDGITSNDEHCRSLVNHSYSMVTALCPIIGYTKASNLAKEAMKTGHTVKEVAITRGMTDINLDYILDAKKMVLE